MNKKVYKKFLADRADNIQAAFKHLQELLDHGQIDYPQFLYLEGNLYQDLIQIQHELNDLNRRGLKCQI